MQPPEIQATALSLGLIGPDLLTTPEAIDQPRLGIQNEAFRKSGFTLAEIAVALGIFSFALVSMMGMLSVGLKNTRKATVQTSASNVLSGIVSDIKASSISLSSSAGTDTQNYTSPKLGISAVLDKKKNTVTGSITPSMPMYISESGSQVSTSSPEVLQKVYSVQITPGADGVPALRVRVEWPANRPQNSRPEGYLETLVPLPL